MPRIVVVGGTGTIGAQVVRMLRDRGDDVGAASRGTGVDLVTGVGLSDALEGAEIIIDVSKTTSSDPESIEEFFARASQNLMSAERAANVVHHIMLSIVGIDRASDVPFYAAKASLEKAVRASGVPFTILRSTQFFEFAPAIAATMTDPASGTVRLPPLVVRPVAGADVAAEIVRLTDAAPLDGVVELAGPEEFELDEFVGAAARRDGARTTVVRDPQGRYFGGRIARRALLPEGRVRVAPTLLSDWRR